jgi:SAM-dependent methyltransferase
VSVKTYSTSPPRGISKPQARIVPCALCGSLEFGRLWRFPGFAFVRCLRCGLIQQNPQPPIKEVLERYAEEYCAYEEKNEEQFLALMLLALKDVRFELEARKHFRRARSEKRAPRFLDVGCATGLLVARLRLLGWDASGVEIDARSAELGSTRRDASIFVGTLESARFPDASFDTVYSSHCIEHLNDPKGWLEEIHRILVPGGSFVCVTPNSSSLQRCLLGASWRSAIYDHLYLFSKKTLFRLAKERNFTLVRNGTWGGLAKGLAPSAVKYSLDHLAKKTGIGDVLVALFRKSPRS